MENAIIFPENASALQGSPALSVNRNAQVAKTAETASLCVAVRMEAFATKIPSSASVRRDGAEKFAQTDASQVVTVLTAR